MAACGYPWEARPPALARLAHLRATLAARLFLASQPWWAAGELQWRPERDIRAAASPGVGTPHVPDAEVLWPSRQCPPSARAMFE